MILLNFAVIAYVKFQINPLDRFCTVIYGQTYRKTDEPDIDI